MFVDADDEVALNKASRILNYNPERINPRGTRKASFIDADQKDFAAIRWIKSAVNLHNNNVGRQVSKLKNCMFYRKCNRSNTIQLVCKGRNRKTL